MTTPSALPQREDLGTIELTGIPFSTFTRSISLGLHELHIPFIHHKDSAPHGPDARKLNPFGLLPSLVHRPQGPFNPNEGAITLFESNAIRRYIDEGLASSPNEKSSLHLTPSLTSNPIGHSTSLSSVTLRSKVDQYVSIASSTLFEVVEKSVVKPLLSMESNGADDATIHVALEGNLQRLESVLRILESMAKDTSNGKDWIMGEEITWSDLFLYPALADLKAVPVGTILELFPWLSEWLTRMESRASVKATYEGTLASQRKGKSKA